MRGQPAAIWLAAVCGFWAAVLTGCNRGPERVVVAGAVTYRGQPLPKGAIAFTPCDGTIAPTTMAAIVDGTYSVEPLRALPVGTYRVSITAVRDRPGRIVRPPVGDDEAPPPNPATEEQYLPAKYNAKSQLKTTIQSGRGSLTRDFVLTD